MGRSSPNLSRSKGRGSKRTYFSGQNFRNDSGQNFRNSQPYRLAGYEDLFVHEPKELLAYDNYAESDTRWLGFDRYRQIWEREINQNFPGFVMYLIEVDRIEVSGDMAWTAFTWYGHVTTSTGQLWPAQHATHGWRRMDGTWRIVHEHLTSGVKEAGLLVETGRTPAVSPADRVVRHSRQRLVARSH